MSDTFVTALIATLIWKLVDFAKQARARNTSAVVTQLLAWAVAFVVIVLFSHSGYAHHALVNGLRLDHVSWADQLLLGLLIGSGASSIVDFKKAIDRSDSAVTPPLIPPRG